MGCLAFLISRVKIILITWYGKARRQAASKAPQPETRTTHAPEAPRITVTATIVRRVQAAVALFVIPNDTTYLR